MVYDEELEKELELYFPESQSYYKKKMFGGICYLINGNMAGGIHKESLILRLGVDEAENAQKDPIFEDFDITGRKMKGWVMVHKNNLKDKNKIDPWIKKAKRFAEKLPKK